MAYDRIEPIGGIRSDYQAAIIASTIANVMSRKRDGSHYTPNEFMPFLDANKAKSMVKRFRANFEDFALRRKPDNADG